MQMSKKKNKTEIIKKKCFEVEIYWWNDFLQAWNEPKSLKTRRILCRLTLLVALNLNPFWPWCHAAIKLCCIQTAEKSAGVLCGTLVLVRSASALKWTLSFIKRFLVWIVVKKLKCSMKKLSHTGCSILEHILDRNVSTYPAILWQRETSKYIFSRADCWFFCLGCWENYES